jgi:hypothetical protein
MTAPKVTDWFPASVKPVHVGVYEAEPYEGLRHYSWWCGTMFHGCWGSPTYAEKQRQSLGGFIVNRWRGLTKRAR